MVESPSPSFFLAWNLVCLLLFAFLVVKMQSLLRAHSQSQHFERNNYVDGICQGAWDLQEANGLGGGCLQFLLFFI